MLRLAACEKNRMASAPFVVFRNAFAGVAMRRAICCLKSGAPTLVMIGSVMVTSFLAIFGIELLQAACAKAFQIEWPLAASVTTPVQLSSSGIRPAKSFACARYLV